MWSRFYLFLAPAHHSFGFTHLLTLVCLLPLSTDRLESLKKCSLVLPSLQASPHCPTAPAGKQNNHYLNTYCVPDPFSFSVSIFTTNVEGIVPVKQVRKLTLRAGPPAQGHKAHQITGIIHSTTSGSKTHTAPNHKNAALYINRLCSYYEPITSQSITSILQMNRGRARLNNFLKVIKPWCSMNEIKMQLAWPPNPGIVRVSCYTTDSALKTTLTALAEVTDLPNPVASFKFSCVRFFCGLTLLTSSLLKLFTWFP